MRTVLIAFLLLAASSASAQTQFDPTRRAFWVQCMSHMESAAQRALLRDKGKQYTKDVRDAVTCAETAREHLTPEQLRQFQNVYEMFMVSIETPAATSQMALITEIQLFLRMMQ